MSSDRREFLKNGLAMGAVVPYLSLGGERPAHSSPWFSTETPSKVASAAGRPVYAYGKIFINGWCPDFETAVVLQEGNHHKQLKIEPKKSWQIKENLIGITPEQAPRSQASDFQPFLCINLIDGNLETSWCSRGQARPDVQPEWIRLDLAKETKVREIVLIPRRDAQGIPSELTIRISRDAWHWDTIYQTKNQPLPKEGELLRFPLGSGTALKQIWIIGDSIPMVYLPDLQTKREHPPSLTLGSSHIDHHFALAGVQAIDEKGEDAALASRGTGVIVSSTFYGFFSDRVICDWLWPVHWDIGVKWIRVAHWDWATLQWSYVEKEKGKYYIDPVTDAALTEMARNGVKIVMALAYGNWLYAPEPRSNQAKNIWNIPYDVPPLPTTPEMLEGYCNFIRFMVDHFKERVEYFELWNEENGGPNYGFGDFVAYSKFVKSIVPVIKEVDLRTKLLLGGAALFDQKFLRGCLDEGVGPLVDAIGWHPFYSTDPDSEAYRNYPAQVAEFKKYAAARGFHGRYMATEWLWSAPYPAFESKGGGPDDQTVTEIQKAKNAARCLIMHLGLSIIPFWVDTWCDMTLQMDSGMFRNTFASNPVNQLAPQPVYYVYRTLCTVMDEARPVALDVRFTNKDATFDNYNFEIAGQGWLVGIWLPGQSADDQPGVPTDVVIRNSRIGTDAGKIKITAIDTLNGFEQEVYFTVEDGRVAIPALRVRDYPLLIKLCLQT